MASKKADSRMKGVNPVFPAFRQAETRGEAMAERLLLAIIGCVLSASQRS
jgi:hypothetical protein